MTTPCGSFYTRATARSHRRVFEQRVGDMKRSDRIRTRCLSRYVLLAVLTLSLLATKASHVPAELRDCPRLRHLKIVVLARNRDRSLLRLFHSLDVSHYDQVRPDLDIHIDMHNDEIHQPTLAVAKAFDYRHGRKSVTLAQNSTGLAMSWYNAWVPRSREEHAVILEDDIVLSPHWFRWLVHMWCTYGDHRQLAGISLQRQTLVPTTPSRQEEIRNSHAPFLYPLVGSIGFSPDPVVWLQFLRWVKAIGNDFDVSTPGLVTSEWWGKLDKRHMWTQHFIYFTLQRRLYTLYQNMPDGTTMASHEREAGVHFEQTKGADFRPSQTLGRIKFPVEISKFDWDAKLLRSESGFDSVTKATFLNRCSLISESHGFVYLLFTNNAFVEMTKNWICNMQSIAPKVLMQTVVLADCSDTVMQLTEMEPRLHYFIYESDYAAAASFGTFAYYRIVLERLFIQNMIIQHGINVMIIESDQIWMSDVHNVLQDAFKSGVQIIAGDEHIHVTGPGSGYICGGFYGIISTEKTRSFFSRYVRKHESNLMKFRRTTGTISVENDQSLLSRLVKKANFSVHWLDLCQYSNGKWYESPIIRASCKTPGVLHNNYIVGTDRKVIRAQTWGHWFLHLGHCANMGAVA